MANRVKEDEKNERTIRNLLKLPDNRRCINCNSLGPQYVCTNFWIFVCTTCSGIHREFTHRVKSVSMAKFTSQEVSALQGGGNASAKEIYFKEWDPQRHSFPDSSNVERLRDFIKHVYVDRRYTGERSFDKPPRVKMGEAEDSFENRRDAYQVGSRSPPYEDTYERRYSERPSPGGRSDDRNYKNTYDERRSPGYDQESRQYGDYRRSPARTEIVNDWRREDRFGSGKRSDDGRISEANSQLEEKSPNRQKDLDVSSPPIVRPVRDILGDNVAPLRIIEPPKANGGRVTDGSLRTQRTASSSSLASSNGNPAESKREDIGTLIDFDAVPEPSTIATVPPSQQTGTGQLVVQPTTSSNADNWARFDSPTVVKVTQAPSNANPLGLVLSELSVPASLAVQTAGIPGTGGFPTTAPSGNSFGAPPFGMPILSFGGNVPVAAPVNNLTMFPPVSAQAGAPPVGYMTMSPFGVGAPAAATTNNLTTFPSGGAPTAAPGSATAFPSNGGQWPMLPQQPSLFPATGFQPTAHTFTPPVNGPSSYQPWNSSIAPNTQGPPSIPAAQTSQALNLVEERSYQRIYLLQLIHLLHHIQAGKLVLPRDMGSICNIILLCPCKCFHIHQNQLTRLMSTMKYLQFKLQHSLPWPPYKVPCQTCQLRQAYCALPALVLLHQHGCRPSQIIPQQCLRRHHLLHLQCLPVHTWANSYQITCHLGSNQ
ncbi:probable ADP-ribosylation factor GTPase-activating protein AGD14 isoform X2 [Actinidia eriantha]|uniref:probable ADP-ribosylation factor GTPase-activating protein AGD14 isoform X2 n=1 Tax=Actinidia eriantha TaxID=165200 RepID=UPI00258B2360|nr:probable ADP-ribosylation factor GTPase-activating protein AGD14 isoform X2 [Actinidia eriantha]